MSLINQQYSDQDQPLYAAECRHDSVLAHGKHSERWEAEPESGKVEKVSCPASVVVTAEKVAFVHLADQDVRHDPRSREEDGLPDGGMAAGYVKNYEDCGREDAGLRLARFEVRCVGVASPRLCPDSFCLRARPPATKTEMTLTPASPRYAHQLNFEKGSGNSPTVRAHDIVKYTEDRNAPCF